MSKKYRSFADEFYLQDASFLTRLERDLRLIRFLVINTWMWAFAGKKMRQEFQQSQNNGEPFYVDRFDPTNKPK